MADHDDVDVGFFFWHCVSAGKSYPGRDVPVKSRAAWFNFRCFQEGLNVSSLNNKVLLKITL